MTLDNKKHDKSLAQFGIYAAVPAILVAGPLIGFFAGQWADEKLGTDPWLMLLGLFLGFGGSAREIYNLIQKAQALDKRKDDD